jgi:methionyl-tRNA formyltransferase
LHAETLRIWRAQLMPDVSGLAGRVLDVSRDGIVIACGTGGLRLTELQRASSKRLLAAEFLLGCPVTRGEQFGT